MNIKKTSTVLFRTACLSILLLAVASSAAWAEKVVYNRYNIHMQDQVDRRGNHHFAASYANYTDPGAGHQIVPPGTPLEVKKANHKQIIFLNKKDNTEIEFDYHEPRMGMSAEQYLELITSPSPISLKKFSSKDRQGIKGGKALAGMTKEGVMTALGYPAAHRTPSLKADTWIYWTNRFGTIAVEFNKQGKVTSVNN